MTFLALVTLAAWIYLVAVHWGFWRADQRLPREIVIPNHWPSVIALVPARNEAPTIGACVAALLAQDYPGAFRVVVIDDHSDDGTADRARAAAADHAERLNVLTAPPLEAGWTGKLGALQAGVASIGTSAEYVWLTDADIVHDPDTLRRLAAHGEAHGRDLVSLMVRLHCTTFWEKVVIPAFVLFFQMLYPFRAVNDDRCPTAAAAGGCVLLRREALERAGGLAAIKGALIDDCALAAAVKGSGGHLWLGLADDSRSLRTAQGLDDLWNMVRRTAFTQLQYSYVLLAGTALGLLLVFIVPPILTVWGLVHGPWEMTVMAGAAWVLMACAYAPTVRDYGLAPGWSVSLPFSAALYGAMTVDSGIAHGRGQGGAWKGRHYDSSATP